MDDNQEKGLFSSERLIIHHIVCSNCEDMAPLHEHGFIVPARLD